MTLTTDELHILVVDDNLINRNNMLQQINQLMPNVVIDEAANGQMSIDLVQAKLARDAKNYAIIIMDFCMPIMNGEEATQQIRALEEARSLTSESRCFLITWSSSKSKPYAGANAVLHKPIIQTELAECLANYLAQ